MCAGQCNFVSIVDCMASYFIANPFARQSLMDAPSYSLAEGLYYVLRAGFFNF